MSPWCGITHRKKGKYRNRDVHFVGYNLIHGFDNQIITHILQTQLLSVNSKMCNELKIGSNKQLSEMGH